MADTLRNTGCRFDVAATTQEDGSHGYLEAPKSTLHPRETPV
jgi:hypothetical protein